MSGYSEIVLRGPIARPPLRPHEVYVTRRVPLVVYFKRCMKLLRGPYARVQIQGAGSCVETAIYLAQDVAAAFGGSLKYVCTAGDEKGPQETAGISAAATPFEKNAAAVFAAAASKLAAIEESEPALLAISAHTGTACAHEEVQALETERHEPTLEAAGISLDLNSFVRERKISAITIQLQRSPAQPQ